MDAILSDQECCHLGRKGNALVEILSHCETQGYHALEVTVFVAEQVKEPVPNEHSAKHANGEEIPTMSWHDL